MKVINIDDVLFEVSNEDRLSILKNLEDTSINVTHISNKLGIRIQQTSRHLQRLSRVGLVEKTVLGNYELTNFGWLLLKVINYADFISNNKDNLKHCIIKKMPIEHIMTLNVFEDSMFLDNAIDFLRFISDNIEKAKEFVYLSVDNLPYLSLDSLIEAPSKNIQVRIIIEEGNSEPSIVFNPVYFKGLDEKPPLVSLRNCEKCDCYMYVSDVGCAVSFRKDSGFDYRGYKSLDSKAISWSKSLFWHKWNEAMS